MCKSSSITGSLFCLEMLRVTQAGLFSGKSNVLQRILNALRFLWVLCQATVDGLTRWLRALTKDHEHLSTILGLERFVLTQQLDQVSARQPGWGCLGGKPAYSRRLIPLHSCPLHAGRGGSKRHPGQVIPAAPTSRQHLAGHGLAWDGSSIAQQHGFQAGAYGAGEGKPESKEIRCIQSNSCWKRLCNPFYAPTAAATGQRSSVVTAPATTLEAPARSKFQPRIFRTTQNSFPATPKSCWLVLRVAPEPPVNCY